MKLAQELQAALEEMRKDAEQVEDEADEGSSASADASTAPAAATDDTSAEARAAKQKKIRPDDPRCETEEAVPSGLKFSLDGVRRTITHCVLGQSSTSAPLCSLLAPTKHRQLQCLFYTLHQSYCLSRSTSPPPPPSASPSPSPSPSPPLSSLSPSPALSFEQRPSVGPPHLGPLRKKCRELVRCCSLRMLLPRPLPTPPCFHCAENVPGWHLRSSTPIALGRTFLVLTAAVFASACACVGWWWRQVGASPGISFPGSQPVSLLKHHLEAIRTSRYLVSHKADGTRCWSGSLCCVLVCACVCWNFCPAISQ